MKKTLNSRSKTNKGSFQFNLESNGRMQTPMKFEIRNVQEGGYTLHEQNDHPLISFGDIWLKKENCKTESCCYENPQLFDYHRIDRALCGKPWSKGKVAHVNPLRITVIQMI